VEIPNVDDHISKLEHMGKETVKKLQDIRGSALAAGIDITVPDNCINKGGCRAALCSCGLVWPGGCA
jgi:predicted Rossmann fold nucleotide-binding protein DprA/Smf involved in DNA uptake